MQPGWRAMQRRWLALLGGGQLIRLVMFGALDSRSAPGLQPGLGTGPLFHLLRQLEKCFCCF